jgi:hypothetical protein
MSNYQIVSYCPQCAAPLYVLNNDQNFPPQTFYSCSCSLHKNVKSVDERLEDIEKSIKELVGIVKEKDEEKTILKG